LFSSPDTPACSALHWERGGSGGSGEIGEVFSLIKMKKKKQRVILFCEAKCYHWPWQSQEMRYWVKNAESQWCQKCKIIFLSLKSNGRLKLNVKNLCGTHDSRLSETVGLFIVVN